MNSRSTIQYFFIIAFSCILAYSTALDSGFIQEDYLVIVNNRDMTHDSFVVDTFRGLGIQPKLTGYYRPLYILSFFADYKIWGFTPAGYHLTNIVIHILVSLLVFMLAMTLTRERSVALLSALLFALHPVNTEVVDYINHRGESLYSLFYLSGILAFLRYRNGNPTPLRLLPSLLFFMASLLTKEGGVTLPLLLFVLDISLLKKERSVKSYNFFLPYLLYSCVLAIYLLIRYLALGDIVVAKQESAPFLHRMITMPGVVLYYVKLLFLPIPLRIYYPTLILEDWLIPSVILPLLSLAVLMAGIIILYFKNRPLFFLSLWPFLILLPNYNLIPIVGFFMAERYLYLPSVGFCILMAMSLNSLLNRQLNNCHARRLLSGIHILKILDSRLKTAGMTTLSKLALPSLIILSFLALTVHRHSVWKSQKTYWETLQKDVEGSFVAYTELGTTYMGGGLIDQAITEFQRALNIAPDYKPALLKLGQAFERKGRYADAVNQYQHILEIDPGNEKARISLGRVYGKMVEKDKVLK